MEKNSYLSYSYLLSLNDTGSRTLVDSAKVFRSMLDGDFSILEKISMEVCEAREKAAPRLKFTRAALHDLPLLLYGKAGRYTGEPTSLTNSVDLLLSSRPKAKTLRLSYRQCLDARTILEAYCRLHTGQLSIAIENLPTEYRREMAGELEGVERYLHTALYGLDTNVSYSVYGGDKGKNRSPSIITYDMVQIIRHKLAWDREPLGGTTVDFGDPLLSYKRGIRGRPLVTIKREGES